MSLRPISLYLFSLLFVLIQFSGYSQSDTLKQTDQAWLRVIGHEFLLSLNDDSSRVLPIDEIDGRYSIRFEREFSLYPGELARIVDSVNLLYRKAKRYVLEVKSCESDTVIYSSIIDVQNDIRGIACATRPLPENCYQFGITILERMEPFNFDFSQTKKSRNEEIGMFWPMMLLVVALLLIIAAVIIFMRRRRSEIPIEETEKRDEKFIHLGAYQFDPNGMLLLLPSQRIELTGKEAELLLLLYQSVNQTIERDTILSKVWGDEGYYVGRTLDVFISKLRKKLAFDENVRIVNIRGVGYKLVVAS